MRLKADGDGRSFYDESREASRHCTGMGVITADTLVFT